MSFTRYENYKDSGHDWLGEIPAHWEVNKFRHCFAESSEKISSEVVGPMLSVSGYRGVEIKGYDDENRRRLDEDLVGYRIVRRGQLVVNTMWLNYAGLGVSDFEGHVSPAYRSHVIGNRVEAGFVHHLMRCSLFVKGYSKFLTGVRPNSLQISRDDLLVFPVLVPPWGEQLAIASFINHEVTKIDALVEEQRRLIELLKEKRQAVISQAVTKGLDPNVAMKDSGVDWLDKVPVHWRVVPIKHVAQVGNGSTPNRDRLDYWEGGHFPWLNSGVVNQGVVVEPTQLVSRVALAECHLPIVQPPAVVVGITGEGKTRGMAALLVIEATLNQHLAFIKTAPEVPAAYVRRYFDMAYERMRFESDGGGSTKGAITCAQLSNMHMPLPPGPEMLLIVEFLDRTLASLSELEAQADAATVLLQERRSALISAAVTGKIDVRSQVAPSEALAA